VSSLKLAAAVVHTAAMMSEWMEWSGVECARLKAIMVLRKGRQTRVGLVRGPLIRPKICFGIEESGGFVERGGLCHNKGLVRAAARQAMVISASIPINTVPGQYSGIAHV
jgi:hypothetical protein